LLTFFLFFLSFTASNHDYSHNNAETSEYGPLRFLDVSKRYMKFSLVSQTIKVLLISPQAAPQSPRGIQTSNLGLATSNCDMNKITAINRGRAPTAAMYCVIGGG